jgi:channel protein (hemolysin III family)
MPASIYAIPGFTEPVSSLTHLIGAAVFGVLGIFLVRRREGGIARSMALSVFAFSSVFLLAMSGVYHLLGADGAARPIMQRLDHCAIFVLIAGSFTPVHVILFRGPARWGVVILIWLIAAAGITFKSIFFIGFPEWLGLAIYMAMGGIGVLSGVVLWQRRGFRFILPLVWGGLAYSVGSLLEFLRLPVIVPHVVGPHELFHLAVLIGLGFHWQFIWGIAPGLSPAVLADEPLASVTPVPVCAAVD